MCSIFLFIMQVYSFSVLFMSFSMNKYLQHYQARQKEHPVVKQSGRLVETVLEVIIITYLISTCTHTHTHRVVVSKSQNHHMWNKHHHH